MNALKRLAGLVWIALAAYAVYLMVHQAGVEFGKNPALDTRIFWYTIIPIFTPIMLGLALFGYYCLKGEYDVLSRKSI
ncbi:MAG: DUF6814 family protein [Saprospiraceae bacterium]